MILTFFTHWIVDSTVNYNLFKKKNEYRNQIYIQYFDMYSRMSVVAWIAIFFGSTVFVFMSNWLVQKGKSRRHGHVT